MIPGPAGRWILLPGVILPAEVVARLNAVCMHSERTRDAWSGRRSRLFIDGYLTGCGLAE